MPRTTYRSAEIARLVGGELSGDPDIVLTGVNSLELATPDQLSFAAFGKRFPDAHASKAGCLIVPSKYPFPAGGRTVIIVEKPKLAFVKAMWAFNPGHQAPPGIHPTAVVDPTATLGTDVHIGPLVAVGPQAKIGDRVTLHPGVVIGDRVEIGEDGVLHPNVTIYHDVVIGKRVLLHGGCVLGSDGFGFVPHEGRHLKVPQLGSIVIGDDVEMGANCTVDRAAFGVTRIGSGTKLDNMVHIAHNVTIGEHCLFAAQNGIAGSAKIGDYVTCGGQVGISDNTTIGDHVIIGAKGGLISNQVVPPNMAIWGFPGRQMHEAKEGWVLSLRLPDLMKRVKALEKRLNELESRA